MNSDDLVKYFEGHNNFDSDGCHIVDTLPYLDRDIVFHKHLRVNFSNKVVFTKKVTFSGSNYFVFKNAYFTEISIDNRCNLTLDKSVIKKLEYDNINGFEQSIEYGSIVFRGSELKEISLHNYYGKVEFENIKIGKLKAGGNYLDVEISGAKSKNCIRRFNFYGEFGTNDNKRQIDISNCTLGDESNQNANTFGAKNINIILTNVDFISEVELTQPFNTFDCDEPVKFEKLNVRNISKKISETSSEAILKDFNVKELCLLETYDKVKLNQLEIGSLKVNNAKKIKNLNISGCNINDFIISSNTIESLEIFSSKESSTRLRLLKFDNQIVNTYIDGYNNSVEINRCEFQNCTVSKDLSLKFYNIKIKELSLRSFLNYGNSIFLDINKTEDDSKGLLEFYNSDLGKTIFMNCNFKDFVVRFSSSKINEIFLAGTDFPPIADENYITLSGTLDYEQKNLCYTQLKRVYESRGDSLNSAKFHEAELSVWKKEIDISENEKLRLKVSEEKKKELHILKLMEEKLIYGQYKKMYEGRGDTVKAIEYFGKEMDLHRTILSKSGGQYWERFQLSLNKFSNNFGQSWHWAVGWIAVVGLLFYMLYCLSLGFRPGNSSAEDIQRFWKLTSYFFDFINPIRKGEFIKLDGVDYYPISNSARVIDFLWRIVITYLGYQLIQAFRKYSKKTT